MHKNPMRKRRNYNLHKLKVYQYQQHQEEQLLLDEKTLKVIRIKFDKRYKR